MARFASKLALAATLVLAAAASGAATVGTGARDSVRPAAAIARGQQGTEVERWIALELDEISLHYQNPVRASRGLALVSVAMHVAALRSPAEASRRAAVAGAASTVLEYLSPGERERFRSLARRAARAGKGGSRGLALGRRIGARVVARAAVDGSQARWSGQVPPGPGLWEPTPPWFLPPVEPLAGGWRPWNLESGAQFRPPPPPRPGSARFDAELREVYEVGRSLTPAQKRIAGFWSDGPGSVTPPGHWNLIALSLIRARRLSLPAAARILATLNTAQADAFIACWDAKFTYWSLRPVTAIQRQLDASWQPYLVTPPFPAYVSGHSTTSAAAAEVLARFFPRQAPRLRRWADEAARSRLYGGIHFRSDNEAGLELGTRVGRAALTSLRDGFPWLEDLGA